MSRKVNFWGTKGNKASVSGEERANILLLACCYQEHGRGVPPTANGRSQSDGFNLMRIYKELGLDLDVAMDSEQSGVCEVLQRMRSGRLRVFRTLENFFQQYRLYRRDERGQVVKQNDLLMNCLRYLCVSGRDPSPSMLPSCVTSLVCPRVPWACMLPSPVCTSALVALGTCTSIFTHRFPRLKCSVGTFTSIS